MYIYSLGNFNYIFCVSVNYAKWKMKLKKTDSHICSAYNYPVYRNLRILDTYRWSQHNIFLCFYMTVITITNNRFLMKLVRLMMNMQAQKCLLYSLHSMESDFLYFVSSVSVLIIEGDFRQSYKKKRKWKRNFTTSLIITFICEWAGILIMLLKSLLIKARERCS